MVVSVTHWNEKENGVLTEDTMLDVLRKTCVAFETVRLAKGRHLMAHMNGMNKRKGILSGRLAIKSGSDVFEGGAGDIIDVPSMTMHETWTIGEEEVVYIDGKKELNSLYAHLTCADY